MPDRTLKFRIFRHNPTDPDSQPHIDEFDMEETPRMTLYTALTELRETIDPSLEFDFVCRSAVCGSCGILINGKPRLGCKTRIDELPDTITLLPLPFFKLVGDLSVDTGVWFRGVAERVRAWIHTDQEFDPSATESRMSAPLANEIYELDRCIECGCCVAGCAAAQMNPGYLGPAGLMRIGRFAADPRDERSDGELFEIISTEDGIFGCIGLLACDDFCPKDLPFTTQLAFLRRKTALTGLRGPKNGR